MKLSQLSLFDIYEGIQVKSDCTGHSGMVTEIYFDEMYHYDDIEKNPMLRISWENLSYSLQPLYNMSQVSIN